MPKLQSSSRRDGNNNNKMNKNTTIRVVAPATLEEGFTFDVLLHGEPYTVTVPPGGVEQGEEFDIPYPLLAAAAAAAARNDNNSSSSSSSHDDDDDDHDEMQQSGSENDNSKNSHNDHHNHHHHNHNDLLGAPMGRWRYPIYACCDVLTQATFWMACFCTPILVAQLITRLRLNWKGNPLDNNNNHNNNNDDYDDDDEASLSFNRIVLSFVAVLMVGQFFPGFGLLLTGIYILILLVWIGGNLRHTMRQRYRIPSSLVQCNHNHNCSSNYYGCCCCCGNDNDNNNVVARYYERIEDGLCMCFCGSCSLIQMARQTHNDKEYPGLCCTTTGLESHAPEIPYHCFLLPASASASTESSK